MSAQIFYNNGSSSSEIITHLTNATDGAGLHFDGTSGNVDIASPPDLGTKFSFEFVLQADDWSTAIATFIIDWGLSGRLIFGSHPVHTSSNLGIHSNGDWDSFGVKVLDDLKVHHLVATISDTAAILYDNGNQVAVATIKAPTPDLAATIRIGSDYLGTASFFNGTIYRARLWNKTLSQTDVTSIYESASLDYADQWGSQTELSSNTDFSGTWSGGVASGYTNTGGTPTEESTIVYGSNTRSQKVALTSTKLDLRVPNATSVAGQNYRFTAFVRSSVGVTIALHDYNGASTANFKTQAIVADTWTEVSGFTIPTNTTRQFQVKTTGAVTADIYVGQISVVASGCVSDYDFSYSNPTQSNIVRNRNDTVTADGTAAGGVVQITAIDQLNSRSARIGTSAATPADGELLVSGAVEPANYINIRGAQNSNNAKIAFTRTDRSWSITNETNLRLYTQNTDTVAPNVRIVEFHSGGVEITGATTSTGGFDGTLGATTPATVAATTINASGVITQSDATGATRLAVTNTANAAAGAGILLRTYNGVNVVSNATIRTDNVGACKIFTGTTGEALRGTFSSTGLAVTGAVTASTLSTFSAGIALGNVASATATTLDYYEEGTHVAAITCGTSGTVTLDAAYDELSYTRIGNKMFVSGLLSVASVSSPVGYLNISLPVAASAGAATWAGPPITVQSVVSANISDFWATIDPSTAFISVYLGDATTIQSDSAEQMKVGTNIRISAQYTV